MRKRLTLATIIIARFLTFAQVYGFESIENDRELYDEECNFYRFAHWLFHDDWKSVQPVFTYRQLRSHVAELDDFSSSEKKLVEHPTFSFFEKIIDKEQYPDWSLETSSADLITPHGGITESLTQSTDAVGPLRSVEWRDPVSDFEEHVIATLSSRAPPKPREWRSTDDHRIWEVAAVVNEEIFLVHLWKADSIELAVFRRNKVATLSKCRSIVTALADMRFTRPRTSGSTVLFTPRRVDDILHSIAAPLSGFALASRMTQAGYDVRFVPPSPMENKETNRFDISLFHERLSKAAGDSKNLILFCEGASAYPCMTFARDNVERLDRIILHGPALARDYEIMLLDDFSGLPEDREKPPLTGVSAYRFLFEPHKYSHHWLRPNRPLYDVENLVQAGELAARTHIISMLKHHSFIMPREETLTINMLFSGYDVRWPKDKPNAGYRVFWPDNAPVGLEFLGRADAEAALRRLEDALRYVPIGPSQ